MAQIAALDRDFANAPGVSPIRCRHHTDIYGVLSGVGFPNPIMVQNLLKNPEPEEYMPADDLAKIGKSAKKDDAPKTKKLDSVKPTIKKNPTKPKKLVETNSQKPSNLGADNY